MVRERDELHRDRVIRGFVSEFPERPKRLRVVEYLSQPFEAALRPPPEQLDEQLVHRAEVVVDEAVVHAGLGRYPSARYSGIPLFDQETLCRVEQRGPGYRVVGDVGIAAGHAE